MDLTEIPREPNALIKPGDHYVAQNNGPARLLTALVISPNGFIVPVESAYPYSENQCVKVTPETYAKFRDKAEQDYKDWLASFYKGAKQTNRY